MEENVLTSPVRTFKDGDVTRFAREVETKFNGRRDHLRLRNRPEFPNVAEFEMGDIIKVEGVLYVSTGESWGELLLKNTEAFAQTWSRKGAIIEGESGLGFEAPEDLVIEAASARAHVEGANPTLIDIIKEGSSIFGKSDLLEIPGNAKKSGRVRPSVRSMERGDVLTVDFVDDGGHEDVTVQVFLRKR